MRIAAPGIGTGTKGVAVTRTKKSWLALLTALCFGALGLLAVPGQASASSNNDATANTCVSWSSTDKTRTSMYKPGTYDLTLVPAKVESALERLGAGGRTNFDTWIKIATNTSTGTKTYTITATGYGWVFGSLAMIENFTYIDPVTGDTYIWKNATNSYKNALLANGCQTDTVPIPTGFDATAECETATVSLPPSSVVYELFITLYNDLGVAQTYNFKTWDEANGWQGNGRFTPLGGGPARDGFPAALTVMDGVLQLPVTYTRVVLEISGMKDAVWQSAGLPYKVKVLDKQITPECPPAPEDPPIRTCTYTIGWYKNHAGQWPTGHAADDGFYTSGQSWLQVFNTPPRGNPYYILAPQFMAAKMTATAGATVPAEVAAALERSEQIFASFAPGTKWTKAQDAELKALGKTLDNYNNGRLGTPHCG